MQITTSRGNTYSYNPCDNSISEGLEEICTSFNVKFKPLTIITELDKIDSFTLGVTEKCNLRCSYCCYSGIYPEHRKHSNCSLKIDDIPNLISFFKKNSKSIRLSFDFYGGESLLEFNWIKEFVSQVSVALPDKTVGFEISTNGVLLNEKNIDWLVQNDFHLFISIDGIGRFHDSRRKDCAGNGTFSIITKNLEYIKSRYMVFWYSKVDFMMTVSDILSLSEISLEWEQSDLLSDKVPIRISEVANIYNSDTIVIDYNTEKLKYLKLIKYRIDNPEELLIKAFFDIWLAEWINRPIFDLKDSVEYPTCLPYNNKLYIDAKGEVGICERITDTIRIGNIRTGLDYGKINKVVTDTADFIRRHCTNCHNARICDICPDVLKLPNEIVKVYCQNQHIIQKIKFLCFCELAEAGMI